MVLIQACFYPISINLVLKCRNSCCESTALFKLICEYFVNRCTDVINLVQMILLIIYFYEIALKNNMKCDAFNVMERF